VEIFKNGREEFGSIVCISPLRWDVYFFLLSDMERKTISMFIVEMKRKDVSSIARYLLCSGLMFTHIIILSISA